MRLHLLVILLAASFSACTSPVVRHARKGSVVAQVALGDACYEEGEYKEAAHWYHMAAAGGSREARMSLGLMCMKGQGVAPDDSEAYEWMRLAFAEEARERKTEDLQDMEEAMKRQRLEELKSARDRLIREMDRAVLDLIHGQEEQKNETWYLAKGEQRDEVLKALDTLLEKARLIPRPQRKGLPKSQRDAEAEACWHLLKDRSESSKSAEEVLRDVERALEEIKQSD